MYNKYLTNTLLYTPQLCNGCRKCSEVCPHGVFIQNGKTALLANPTRCMECGACQMNCPTQAISVESGVGCAAAMMWSAIRGQKEVTCGCSCG